jgi:hypothetical protein
MFHGIFNIIFILLFTQVCGIFSSHYTSNQFYSILTFFKALSWTEPSSLLSVIPNIIYESNNLSRWCNWRQIMSRLGLTQTKNSNFVFSNVAKILLVSCKESTPNCFIWFSVTYKIESFLNINICKSQHVSIIEFLAKFLVELQETNTTKKTYHFGRNHLKFQCKPVRETIYLHIILWVCSKNPALISQVKGIPRYLIVNCSLNEITFHIKTIKKKLTKSVNQVKIRIKK